MSSVARTLIQHHYYLRMKKAAPFSGNWNETKDKLKKKFAMLSDSDVLLGEGKQDELLGRLQIRLGKTREEIVELIEGL